MSSPCDICSSFPCKLTPESPKCPHHDKVESKFLYAGPSFIPPEAYASGDQRTELILRSNIEILETKFNDLHEYAVENPQQWTPEFTARVAVLGGRMMMMVGEMLKPPPPKSGNDCR